MIADCILCGGQELGSFSIELLPAVYWEFAVAAETVVDGPMSYSMSPKHKAARLSKTVGCVERSDAHAVVTALTFRVGLALLGPSYRRRLSAEPRQVTARGACRRQSAGQKSA